MNQIVIPKIEFSSCVRENNYLAQENVRTPGITIYGSSLDEKYRTVKVI